MKKMQSSSLRLEQLNKTYDTFQAVTDVNLDIPGGSILTLLGPSGCGKTTILRMIAGFSNVTSGRILVDGTDISGIEPNFRDIGMVFQNYALFPHMTVAKNVAFGLQMRGVSRSEQATAVADALEMVKLSHLADRYPSQLSGGQQQRVALARALIIKPKLLLLDEPLGALDRHLREGLQMELRNLQRELGITTVLVTHDQEEALYLADHLAVMNKGRVEQLDNPLSLYDRPRTEFVARFLGVPNIFDAVVLDSGATGTTISLRGHAITLDRKLPLATGAACKVSVRPSHVELVAADDPRPGLAANVVIGRELGERTAYHLESGGLMIEANASRMRSVERFAEGSAVKLVFDPVHTVVLEA